tara:strand:+ start:1359 stop:1856 length:498 start_codon:yes stop_codon:yes gene_type:complete
MGFDLSGINPQINKPETDYKYYKEDVWAHDLPEKDRKKYFKEMNEYHEANPGVYFRNNVWWWRPLWNFVCDKCSDILTEDDFQAGGYNDGWEISPKKAYKLGIKLKKLIEDGDVDSYEKDYKKHREELAESEDEDVKFLSNYPFSKDNVDSFADFCLQSGGFVIC